jgi:TonB-linked SusC/RagA family outer membrane protein
MNLSMNEVFMLKKLQLLAFALLLPVISVAQSGSVTGTITDANTGEPLIGATVSLKSQPSIGAAADVNGEYNLSNLSPGTYVLVAQFVGFKRAETTVEVSSENLTVNFTLSEDLLGLDELIVTGYSTQLKREITGSISSIRAQEISKVPQQNAAGILQGRAAGVTVTSTSGTPGAGLQVRIRGIGSINADSDPLYVVDGVQMSFTNLSGTNDNTPLNAIDPDDIESIEILKDAAASAIYGSQAANGVVLITTKSGRNTGKPIVTLSTQRGATTFIQGNEYFSRDQAIEYGIASFAYDGAADPEQAYRNNFLPAFGFSPDTPFSELPDTDWYDFNNQTGTSEEYRISVTGGNEASTYRISAGYENTDGYIKENNFENYNIAGRFNQQLSDKLSSEFNVRLSSQSFAGPCQDGFFTNCPISAAGFTSPLSRPYLDDGSYSPYFLFGAGTNPALIFNENSRETKVLQILTSLAARYEVSNTLSIRTQVSMDYREDNDKIYSSPLGRPASSGRLTHIEANTPNFQTNTTINYANSFGTSHNVSGLVGFEYRRDYTSQVLVQGEGFPNGFFDVLDLTATPTAAGGFNTEFRTAGYFTSWKYNYDEKYFLTVTARYDGSSKFGSETKFGFFPSASVGWAISEEDFFNFEKVDDLKVRLSYGSTGNQGIGNFAALGLYGESGSYGGVTALSATQLGNDLLSWEASETINAGLDLTLFEGRVNTSVDVYRKTNSDLLLGEPLPLSSGFEDVTRNIGKVQNEGIEFQINTVNVQRGDFQWSTRMNIATNRNEILELSDGTEELFPGDAVPFRVGKSVNAIQAVRWAGVNPADGRPMWYDKDGNLTYTPVFNEDAVFIDGADQDVIGGFGNTLRYKGFSLDAFFQYSFGQNAQPTQVVAFALNQVGGSGTNGLVRRLEDAWREPGDVAPFPAPTNGFAYPGTAGYFIDSSDKFYNASYIRLKNITASYSLPVSMIEKLNLRSVQFFVSGLNLITWTSYIGYDPEVAGVTTRASIPVGRAVNGGIEIQF